MPGPLSTSLGFVDDIVRWRQGVGTRAPSYHRVFEELVGLLQDGSREGVEVGDRLDDAWARRTFRIFYDRPLLFVAAVRMDALVVGENHPLWPAIAAPEPDPASVTRGALLEALGVDSVWHSLATRFVQTNETSRALAWLWPAQIVGCGDGQRPLALVEAGPAAGLNLVADRLPSPWTTSSGQPLPTARTPHTVARVGIDAHPLDARDDDHASWLRACVWAGEHQRIARLEAAISAFRASPAQLERGDVTDVPQRARALSSQAEDTVVLAFQTLVRDYLDHDVRAAYQRSMLRWLEDAPAASALWVELEIDHRGKGKGVPLVAHAREGSRIVELGLGVTDFHPSAVAVDDASVARLAGIFR